jgi:hypothetical protein
MKKLLLILLGCFFLNVATVNAQEPAPLPDTVGDKVKQGDPEVKNPPPSVNYLSDAVRITSKEIPAAVKRTLESGTQYTGWERASIYKDKDGNKYIVEMKDADTTRVFRFGKDGKPLFD